MKVNLREKKLKHGRKSLFLDFFIYGHRTIEYLNIHIEKENGNNKHENVEKRRVAEMVRAQREYEILRGQYNVPDYKKRKLDLVQYYKKQVDKRSKDRSTWHNSYSKLNRFSKGSISFGDITPEWIEQYQQFLLSEVAGTTAYHYYANFKYVVYHAMKEKIITENPCVLVKNLKKPDVKRDYLLLEEIQILSNTECPNPEVKQAFLFSCFTGLRLSDIYNLKWENIKSDVIEYRQKKTERNEYLDLPETAKDILSKKRIEKNIFPMPNMKIFKIPTISPLSNNIRRWVKESKINKRITFHSARHTFATLCLTNGVDLYTVSKLLGHKDITTTQIYAKIVDAKKKEAVKLIPKISV